MNFKDIIVEVPASNQCASFYIYMRYAIRRSKFLLVKRSHEYSTVVLDIFCQESRTMFTDVGVEGGRVSEYASSGPTP